MGRILDIHLRLADGQICPADTEWLLLEHNHLTVERRFFQQQRNDYRTALTRILKWARDNAVDIDYIIDDGGQLFEILADAGFEIDNDDALLIDGERVRE